MLTFKDYLIKEDKDPCWKNYEMVGMKKKNGKEVPNCVPKEETEISEETEHIVHVDDGSKYDEEPHPKDVEHVNAGVKKHGGSFAGHSDKGAYFKFKSRTDARNFKDHVNKSPHKSTYADLHEELEEATYKGKEVPLNKPMAGDVAKSKVFVDPDGDGKATKVNFGDKNMTIKKHIPARRKSFRARHNCDTAKDKSTARYWSCKKW
jgi:hypothetical protein